MKIEKPLLWMAEFLTRSRSGWFRREILHGTDCNVLRPGGQPRGFAMTQLGAESLVRRFRGAIALKFVEFARHRDGGFGSCRVARQWRNQRFGDRAARFVRLRCWSDRFPLVVEAGAADRRRTG